MEFFSQFSFIHHVPTMSPATSIFSTISTHQSSLWWGFSVMGKEEEKLENYSEMLGNVQTNLAGTAFHSSQNVIKDEVTRMIPALLDVKKRRKKNEKWKISSTFPPFQAGSIFFTWYENCRKIESSIPRKCQLNFQTWIISFIKTRKEEVQIYLPPAIFQVHIENKKCVTIPYHASCPFPHSCRLNSLWDTH